MNGIGAGRKVRCHKRAVDFPGVRLIDTGQNPRPLQSGGFRPGPPPFSFVPDSLLIS
jgi:hypothetical protein